MRRRDELVPVRDAIRRTTGMKMATTAVELMTAPRRVAASMSRTSRRVSPLPPFSRIQSPTR
jgi:hypothetical protein